MGVSVHDYINKYNHDFDEFSVGYPFPWIMPSRQSHVGDFQFK